MRVKKVLIIILLIAFCSAAVLAADEVNPPEVNTSDQPKPENELKDAIIDTLMCVPFMGISYAVTNGSLEFESGLVGAGYSDVRIPGDSGTLFSLSSDLTANPVLFYRGRITLPIADRHHISLLYAPLWVASQGKFDRDIIFAGQTFSKNTAIDALYKFNSYRLTYRYDLVSSFRTDFGLGLTVKVRDADIRLKGDGKTARKSNVGLVPLINFRYHRGLNDKFGFLAEGDALAAPQGRAEDILLAMDYKLSRHFKLKAGYRMLEGGADNDEVYNFALFNYAVLGVQYGR
jgi:hypothetical protein